MNRTINFTPDEKPKHENDNRLHDSPKGVHFYTRCYAIFRIGKSFKTMAQIKNFEKHMKHISVYNANKELTHGNRVLIGDMDIQNNVKDYIKDIKLRVNANIGKDVLLTASPDFFTGLTEDQKEEWLDLNVKFLKDNFGENCVHASLHVDEKTWHIHALIIPKFYNDKKHCHVLASNRYFDGISKLVAWQDNYSKSMQVKYQALNRGIRFSKTSHVQLEQYYNFVNKKFDGKDINQAVALANKSVEVMKQLKEIKETLNIYQNYIGKSDKEKSEMKQLNNKLAEKFIKMRDDKELYKEAVSALAEIYNNPKEQIKRTISEIIKMNNRDKEKENSNDTELNKD